MMFSSNKQKLIAKCLFYQENPLVLRLIQEMMFIYIHAFWKEWHAQTWSLIALPIVETQLKNFGLYSTNVISISDGQIFAPSELCWTFMDRSP